MCAALRLKHTRLSDSDSSCSFVEQDENIARYNPAALTDAKIKALIVGKHKGIILLQPLPSAPSRFPHPFHSSPRPHFHLRLDHGHRL